MSKPCGCGGGGTPTANSEGAKTGFGVKVGTNGVTELASYEGCFQPYNGKRRGDSVYVVGLPSEPDDERIFLRQQADDAIAYAKEKRLRLHHLPTRQLCHQAMVDTFGE